MLVALLTICTEQSTLREEGKKKKRRRKEKEGKKNREGVVPDVPLSSSGLALPCSDLISLISYFLSYSALCYYLGSATEEGGGGWGPLSYQP